MRPMPAQPRRIVLINPTRFLGNLLIAGGLMQDFAAHCRARGCEFRIVVDAAFAELLAGAFDPQQLILYPRRAISAATLPGKARLYLRCLREIRAFKADIAFNIEDDSVAHRLTQFSGASFRLGCSPARHRYGYEQVLPIHFTGRAAGEAHRWFAFRDVFTALGLPPAIEPGYLRLSPPPLSPAELTRLQGCGVDFSRPLALLHPGATKAYKLWPVTHFAELAGLLVARGFQVVLMGAGADAQHVAAIQALLPPALQTQVVSVCNQLTLAQLATFMRSASVMVGNDSGPFHLAAALGLRGAVIFGPTEAELWGPLGNNATLVQDRSVCRADCSRHHCEQNYRCLSALTPQRVLQALADTAPSQQA